MGTVVWILLWGLTCCMAMQQIVISPPATTSECSTWGNHYFQTFDGAQYKFPGTCFYLFAQQCTGSRIAFNIMVRRSIRDGNNVILFSAIIDDIDIEVTESGIAVQGKELIGSYSEKSVLVEQDCAYLIMTSKLGVVLKWNYNDTLLLYLEDKYKGSTCGLCGDYNGDDANDVAINGVQVSPRQFGNQQKINRPSEKCPDVPADANGDPTGANQCAEERAWCASIIKRFGNCYGFLAIDDYVTMCTNDMCNCDSNSSVNCACGTLNMYSRRCVQAGGDPGKWRKSDLCDRPCPDNMVYMECGSPCPNTCSNSLRSSLCSDAKCTDGCFCHTGMILDDVMNTGCVPWGNCPCMFKGKSFASGDHYSTACETCACSDGQWNCKSQPCSGYCEVLGGSHIITYDGKDFSFNGNCLYVISKSNDIAQSFAVLGELFQCGMSSTVTCLKTVSLVLKYKVIKVCHCGSVYINEALVNLPFKDAEVIILKRSTDFITIQSTLQVQLDIQLNPVMQLFVYMSASYKGQVSGLCGNFNGLEVDDTQTASGVIEESAAAFVNSLKTQASCPDSKDIYDDPCSASSDKEQYAEHWCSLLNADVFAKCSMFVDATPYYKNCKYDTCNSESSQDALIAILSAYAKHCTDEGVILDNWKDLITDSSASCPKSMVFSTAVRFCNTSCFSLTQKDPLCDVVVNPVQGCGCPDGTYLDSYGTCVSPDSCTCIYKDDVISPGETFQVGSITCKCIQGKIECIGAPKPIVCSSPMQFYDCESGGSNPVGIECQKSCTTQNDICYSKQCVSGCVCPNGLVTDGNGGCITEDQCPCMHNGKAYQRGQNITTDCKTCTCMNRIWTCTDNPCTGVCSMYGNGHYLSFDGKQFDYTTNCDYILTQDFCPNNPNEGTFRVIGEVTSCGHNNAICAMTVRIKIKSTEMRLVEGGVQMIQTSPNPPEVTYTLSIKGFYIAVTTFNGVTIMWDQKTTVFVRLETSYAGKVCGLCGNFNGRENDDFTTQGQSLETNAQSFGKSWKLTSSCPNTVVSNLCSTNPYRQVWAQRHCSIIKSDLFRPCHTMVNPMQYYDSCVSDSCACDSGGVCECFCSAVAVYAQACSSAGVCIDWRTPDQCPPFCDYYNPKGECSWHYEPCGSSCPKTCRNPRQRCTDNTFSLEGCYPKCTGANSYYDDALMTCVPLLNCTTCTPEEMLCSDDLQDCLCCYAGKTYRLHQEIYRGGDGKNCLTATCGSNGQIKVDNYPCGSHPYAPTTSVLIGSTISPTAHVSDAVGPGGPSSLGAGGDGGDMPIKPNTSGIQSAVGGSASGNQNSASGTQDSSSTVLIGSTISPTAHVSDAVGPGGPSSLGAGGDGGDMPIKPNTSGIQSAVGGSASGNQNSASGTQDSSSTVLIGSTISPTAHVSDAVGPGGPSSLGAGGDGGDMPIKPNTSGIQSAVGGSASGNQNSASGTQDSSSTVLIGSTISPTAHVSDAVGPGGPSSLGAGGDGGDMPIKPNTSGIQSAVGGSASGNQNSASGTQDSSSTVLIGSTISPTAHVSDAVGPGGPSSLGAGGDGGDMPIKPNTSGIQSAVGGSASGNQNSASGTQDSSSTVLIGSTISPTAHVSDAVGPGGPSSLGAGGDGGDMPIKPNTSGIQSAVGGSASGNQNSASGTQDSSSTVLIGSTISPTAHVSDAVGPGGPSSLGAGGDGGDMPIKPNTSGIQSAVGGSASGNQNSASGTQDSSSTVLIGSTISPTAHVSDAVGPGGPSSLGAGGDGGDMPIKPNTSGIQSAVGGSASGNQNSASGTQDSSSTVLIGSTISPTAHVSDVVGPGGPSSLGAGGDGGDMPIKPNTSGIQSAVGGSASGNQNSASGTQDSSSTVLIGSTISPTAHVSDAVGPGGPSSLGAGGDGGDMQHIPGTPVTQSAVGGITSGSQNSTSTTQESSSTVLIGSTISPTAQVSDVVDPGGPSSPGGAGDGGDMPNMSGTPVTQSAVGGISSGSQNSTSTTQQSSSTGCMEEQCYWSDWYDTMKPQLAGLGDFETIASIREIDSSLCSAPSDIDCRAGQVPEVPLTGIGQKVTCNPTVGLECYNADQALPLCYNYIVKIKCCSLVPCTTTGPTSGPDNGLTTAGSNSESGHSSITMASGGVPGVSPGQPPGETLGSLHHMGSGCVEMSGVQRAPGDQWQEDCRDYTCDGESLNITSVPHACPTSAPVVCTNEGEVARKQTLLADPCCTETVCVCDTQHCSTEFVECLLGFQKTVSYPSKACCPQYTCTPKNVCVYNGMEYQPGNAVPNDSCQDCKCSDSFDPMLQTNTLICSPRVCSTDCEPGFTYEDVVDGCCGVCKQTACAVSFPSGVITIEPNSEYQAPDNNCTLYKCIDSNGHLVNMPVNVSCPYFNPDNCITATIGKSSDGCCDTCIEVSQGCQMKTEMKSIVNDGCVTTHDIEVRSCEGACSSSYMFYAEVGQMVLECSCCRDRQSHIEEITLFCPETNTTTPYKYTFIDNCGCSQTKCV